MDEEYDAVVLGTGMIECVISGLLSVSKKKVLHIDRNSYYGGDLASVTLKDLFGIFKTDEGSIGTYGEQREWNVDLTLKLILAESDLVSMLVYTGVTRYLDFKQVDNSFILRSNQIRRVPITEAEVFKSGMLGLMEKKRMISMVMDLKKCDLAQEQVPKQFTKNSTMREVYKRYGFNEDTQELIGHVISLHQNDSYLDRSCLETFRRMQCYSMSLNKYGKSPYLYPMYGMGEIPQAFARLSAIYGGTYMLNTPVDGIVRDEATNKVVGVKSGEHVIKTKMVIADPSYFPELVEWDNKQQVVKCICLLDHPVRNIDANTNSCQIIIPARQTGRKSDIYVGMVSKANEVCPSGFYIAVIMTMVENEAAPFEDVKPGFNLLQPVKQHFLSVSKMFKPKGDGRSDNVFISKSYDGTTHFDTATDEIHDLWTRIMGEKLDCKKLPTNLMENS